MIEVTISEDLQHNRKVVTAYIPYADLAEIKLDVIDRAVLLSPSETAADVFQDLEILARRQAQQSGKEEDSKSCSPTPL